jgi:hypothetical protein
VRKKLPQLTAQSALSSAFLAETYLEKLEFGLGPYPTIIGSLNLNMMLKIEFKFIRMAYRLQDIKGYHTLFFFDL